jgi:hypothetical protein
MNQDETSAAFDDRLTSSALATSRQELQHAWVRIMSLQQRIEDLEWAGTTLLDHTDRYFCNGKDPDYKLETDNHVRVILGRKPIVMP